MALIFLLWAIALSRCFGGMEAAIRWTIPCDKENTITESDGKCICAKNYYYDNSYENNIYSQGCYACGIKYPNSGNAEGGLYYACKCNPGYEPKDSFSAEDGCVPCPNDTTKPEVGNTKCIGPGAQVSKEKTAWVKTPVAICFFCIIVFA